jgi:hypothetical protein
LTLASDLQNYLHNFIEKVDGLFYLDPDNVWRGIHEKRYHFEIFFDRKKVTIFRMSEKRNCMPEKRFCIKIKKHNPKKKFK